MPTMHRVCLVVDQGEGENYRLLVLSELPARCWQDAANGQLPGMLTFPPRYMDTRHAANVYLDAIPPEWWLSAAAQGHTPDDVRILSLRSLGFTQDFREKKHAKAV
jgi:hypothetical protein